MDTPALVRDEATGRYRLVGPVHLHTVSRLAALPEALPEALAEGDAEIDLSALEEADSGTLALLVLWQRTALQRGGRLRFRGFPERLRSLIDLYDLREVLLDGAQADA